MAKDRRIWIKLAVQMPDSLKIAQLSDAAFRAHIEALCYCRDLRTDGVIPRRVALQRWGQEAIDELLSNDPESPSWRPHKVGFEVHDYLEHQESRADIEAREAQAREAGAKGGAKRAANRSAKRAATASAQANPQAKALAESESESERLITTHLVSRTVDARESTDSKEQIEASKNLANGIGVNLDRVIVQASDVARSLTHSEALKLATFILAKASTPPKSPMGYITTAFKNDPFEVQKWIDTEVMV